MTHLLAFHNDPSLKEFVLTELGRHRAQDQLVQAHGYWAGGKGCAVGCTLEAVRLFSGDTTIAHDLHVLYETRLGIPQRLARLEDGIFEGLPREASQLWPERVISAIAPGSALTMIWPRFALWLLDEELPPLVLGKEGVTAALANVAALYREWTETGKSPRRERWTKADAAAAYAAAAAAAARAVSRERQADKLIDLLRAALKSTNNSRRDTYPGDRND